MTANQTATGYVVSAFRTRRDYLLGHPDYSRTVVDEPGQPPASERADALWSELLLNRPARLRFGWQIITRAPLTDPKVIRP